MGVWKQILILGARDSSKAPSANKETTCDYAQLQEQKLK